MSCKLWLNVWTCRSFTCPFTLRNLDRNPTAALISGFIVPRAQRVCIEKATAIRERFVVFPFFCPATCLSDDCSSPLQSDPCVMALVLCFSWHLIRRGSRMLSRGREPGRITFGEKKYKTLLVFFFKCVNPGGFIVEKSATSGQPLLFASLSTVELSEWWLALL